MKEERVLSPRLTRLIRLKWKAREHGAPRAILERIQGEIATEGERVLATPPPRQLKRRSMLRLLKR